MQKTRGNHPTRVTVSRADCHLLPPGRAVPGSTCCRRTEHETSRHKSERLVSSNLRVSPQIESRRCRHRLSLQAVLAPGRQGRLPPAAAGPGRARFHLLPPGRAVPGSTCCRRTKHETSRHKSERLVSSNLRVSPQIESRRCRHRLSLPTANPRGNLRIRRP